MTGPSPSFIALTRNPSLAPPERKFEPLPHDPNAITITNPALTRWATKRAA